MTPFAEFILSRFEARKETNPRYSFRAFSRDLEMSPGRMINYIKGRQLPTEEIIKRIGKNLKLDLQEMEELREAIESARYLRRGHHFQKQLTPDEFKTISDWKTWSVLTAFQSQKLGISAGRIAQILNLSALDVEDSLQKLEVAGLIKKIDNKFELLYQNVTTTNDFPSEDLRTIHKEFIQLAINALENVPVLDRDVSGITMCIDKSKLPELKKMLSEFRARFCQLAESNEGTEVYQLNMQFFPMKGHE